MKICFNTSGDDHINTQIKYVKITFIQAKYCQKQNTMLIVHRDDENENITLKHT